MINSTATAIQPLVHHLYNHLYNHSMQYIRQYNLSTTSTGLCSLQYKQVLSYLILSYLILSYLILSYLHNESSVADPGCLSRIPNPELTRSRIRDPHQRIQVFLTQKTISKKSKIRSGIFIPDPGSWLGFFFHPRSRILGSKSSKTEQYIAVTSTVFLPVQPTTN